MTTPEHPLITLARQQIADREALQSNLVSQLNMEDRVDAALRRIPKTAAEFRALPIEEKLVVLDLMAEYRRQWPPAHHTNPDNDIKKVPSIRERLIAELAKQRALADDEAWIDAAFDPVVAGKRASAPRPPLTLSLEPVAPNDVLITCVSGYPWFPWSLGRVDGVEVYFALQADKPLARPVNGVAGLPGDPYISGFLSRAHVEELRANLSREARTALDAGGLHIVDDLRELQTEATLTRRLNLDVKPNEDALRWIAQQQSKMLLALLQAPGISGSHTTYYEHAVDAAQRRIITLPAQFADMFNPFMDVRDMGRVLAAWWAPAAKEVTK